MDSDVASDSTSDVAIDSDFAADSDTETEALPFISVFSVSSAPLVTLFATIALSDASLSSSEYVSAQLSIVCSVTLSLGLSLTLSDCDATSLDILSTELFSSSAAITTSAP